MTDLPTSIALGILQGLTEFLPVSSSGHLAIAMPLLGVDEKTVLPLSVALHLATTLAVLAWFRRDILGLVRGLGSGPGEERERALRLVLLLALASVPAALIGVLAKGFIESLFTSPHAIATGLGLTGLVLVASDRMRGGAPLERLTAGKALLVGVAQGIAIAPGVSRSGATIGAALLLGLDRRAAFVFSFLLSVPAVLGAAVLEGRHLGPPDAGAILSLVFGMTAAFLAGLAALALLSRWVRAGRLSRFALYCWLLALVIVAAL